MIDLETLGNLPTSVITQIGAVAFDDYGVTGPEFLIHVDIQDCINKGLTMDASTICWWLEQSDEARKQIIEGQKNKPLSLDHALFELRAFIESLTPSTLEIWGNSNRFDLGILHNAYLKTKNTRLPWLFRNERDVRTVVMLYPAIKDKWVNNFKGIKHDPIADCKCQIGYVSEILNSIKIV